MFAVSWTTHAHSTLSVHTQVMSIMKFSDVDEVVARANNSDYGLAAAIFSSDFPKARMCVIYL
eukprot:SAG22_NODE_6242_length_881_cov_1.586957_2_plen_63_part_00